MRLRIKRSLSGTIEGTDLSRFIQGLTYDVGTRLANVMLAEGWAEPVDDAERDEPALVIPLSRFSNPSVLVVEDDDSARRLVAETLRHNGYTVHEARDGREGLKKLQAHRPSVILLDLSMPRMDGRQFRTAQQKLADPELARVPVIVVSGVDDARAQAREIGAKGIIVKPVDPDRLLKHVAREAPGRSRRNC
jgi:CheY-like chemotaxis protein